MLIKKSSDYIEQPKEACNMDLYPLSETVKMFPSGTPKVINTHFRLDVLPREFQGQKTVLGKLLPYHINLR